MKSILGWFGIGQSSIDAGLMLGEWGNLFRGIAKDIAGVRRGCQWNRKRYKTYKN